MVAASMGITGLRWPVPAPPISRRGDPSNLVRASRLLGRAHTWGRRRTWPEWNPMIDLVPPNSALQRAAFGIKCSAAGGRAKIAPERRRARVLQCRRAVAALGRYA